MTPPPHGHERRFKDVVGGLRGTRPLNDVALEARATICGPDASDQITVAPHRALSSQSDGSCATSSTHMGKLMKPKDRPGDWERLGLLNAVAEERKAHMASLARNAYGAIAGYFGNTMILRDAAGQIVQLTRYCADHSMSIWREGLWREGKWLINNGQDSSIVAHTRTVRGKTLTWCHVFAPHKNIGDRWISPETHAGHPTYPLAGGGIPVVEMGGQLVVEGTDRSPGPYFSLEAGLVPEPYEIAPALPIHLEPETQWESLGDQPDAAMAGYFDNSMLMLDATGTVIHVLNYRPDHSVNGWRDGIWVEGQWLLNNAQDHSTLFQTRDLFGGTASWAHSFSPYKRVGDYWIAPETRGGHPPYPIEVGGIPVEYIDGKPVISGTRYAPSLVMSMVAGLYPAPWNA